MTYDVLIIGGGPIGIACALEAKRKIYHTSLLKKEHLSIRCTTILKT